MEAAFDPYDLASVSRILRTISPNLRRQCTPVSRIVHPKGFRCVERQSVIPTTPDPRTLLMTDARAFRGFRVGHVYPLSLIGV